MKTVMTFSHHRNALFSRIRTSVLSYLNKVQKTLNCK